MDFIDGVTGRKSRGFKQLVKKLNPTYNVPDREYFSALLCDNRVQLLISYKVLLV